MTVTKSQLLSSAAHMESNTQRHWIRLWEMIQSSHALECAFISF